MKFELKKFSDLTIDNLYNLIKIRQSIFIVEQNCPYNDLDNKDQSSLHLLGYKKNELVSYARIFPPGILSPEAVIGRILVIKKHRSQGLGFSLINKSLEIIKSDFGNVSIKIEAQIYLYDFYQKFGFKSTGKEYLEDGIPHISMILM